VRTLEHWKNWNRKHFKPAAEKANVGVTRPYELRHTWASLLIQEGKLTLIEIAAQMGHSVQTLLNNYAHVIAELSGTHRPVEELIREAKRPHNVPTGEAAGAKVLPFRSTKPSPRPDSNRRPLPYHGSALPTELRGRVGRA
jgi:hypothetical protein